MTLNSLDGHSMCMPYPRACSCWLIIAEMHPQLYLDITLWERLGRWAKTRVRGWRWLPWTVRLTLDPSTGHTNYDDPALEHALLINWLLLQSCNSNLYLDITIRSLVDRGMEESAFLVWVLPGIIWKFVSWWDILQLIATQKCSLLLYLDITNNKIAELKKMGKGVTDILNWWCNPGGWLNTFVNP